MIPAKPLAPLLSLLLHAGIAHAQTDDFEDGNDIGWTHQDSLGVITGTPFASFEFPQGGYRIQAAESPAPASYGPSRAASLRQDVSYAGPLFLSVDLRISNPALQQAVGVLAFVQPAPGPGATAGYALSFQPVTGDLVLNRIVNESPIELAYSDLIATAGNDLRLIFIAEDGLLSGAVYNLDDLFNPIATVAAIDTQYASGTAGVFVFSDTDDGSGPVDAIFDNYRANPLTLPDLRITRTGEGGIQLRWPDWAVHFAPSCSPDLLPESWQPIPASALASGNSFLSYTVPGTLFPGEFFRLERRPF